MVKKVSLTICAIALGVLFLYVGFYLISFMDVYDKIDTSNYTIMQHTNYVFVYAFGAVGAIVFTVGSCMAPMVSIIKIWKD
jgi:hypothetical protein